MANHYKTADEEESLSSFFSFCNPIISAWFHSYNVPFSAHVPISATDRAIIVFFNFLMLIHFWYIFYLQLNSNSMTMDLILELKI